MEIRLKSFTRSIGGLVFSLLLLIVAFARPALAQSDQDASPDSKTAVSELSVAPTTLSYGVNLDKAPSESKHFTLANTGTLDLDATVNAPAGTDAGDYTISGPGLSAAGGTITIPGKVKNSKANIVEVDVTFAPTGAGKKLDATILVTNTGTKGKQSDTIKLSGSAPQKEESPQGLWVVNLEFFDEFQGKSLQKSGSPNATFALTSGECCPSFPDLTFDQAGNLWVPFTAEGVGVGELTRDELNTSKRVLRFHVELSLVASGAADPFLYPSTLAFDPAGDLWVAGTAPTRTLIEFTPDQLATSGNPTPASTINFSGDSTVGPSRIRFDSAGDLWIAEETLLSDDSEAAIEYTPTQITEMQMGGSPTPILTVLAGSGLNGISAITFDQSGNLWMAVTNPGTGADGVAGGIVEMFNVAGKAGTLSQPNVVITPAAISPINQSLDRPSGLAFDNQEGLWVSSNLSSDQIPGSQNSTGFIVRFAANQLAASGCPVPPIVLTPNRKASNLHNPSPIIFGPTVK